MTARPPITRTRRQAIAFAAAAAATGVSLGLASRAVAQTLAATAPSAPLPAPNPRRLKFFSGSEFALLDELAEMIIPADERSGGARAANVALFIDAHLAESVDPEWRQSWRDDLAEIERLSRAMFGRRFVEASEAQRTRLLQRISKNEANPKEAGEYAFGTIKWVVGDIYYRTAIDIHDELNYQSNRVQDEFTGIDVSKG